MPELNIGDYLAHPLVRYRNHLEFNGYQVEEDNELLLCRHSRKHNLIVKYIPERGVLIRALYSSKPNINIIQLLEYVNQLNSDFMFMKAYIYNPTNDLFLESFSAGEYDRTTFSILLDSLEYDMELFGNNKLTQHYLQ